MKEKKFVIITSVHAPGAAVEAFVKWPGWRVVVVGDMKTPDDWHCEGVEYLDIKRQAAEFGEFAAQLSTNTYTRKMIGYAYAIKNGATAIFDTDDDNIPYPDAVKIIDEFADHPFLRRAGERCRSMSGWLNAYELFGAKKCWPRGFPLEKIKSSTGQVEEGMSCKPWAVIQFLVDEDPDVDAIYRMIDGRPVYFMRGASFIFDEGSFCPVNSQSTLWTPAAFPFLFLPVGVSDRVTDILRGYIATCALWKASQAVAYASPIAHQKRNIHDLKRDFLDEIPLYSNVASWCWHLRMADDDRSALQTLVDMDVIPEINLHLYDLFLSAAGLTR